jgi:Protein of unknown function (DUF3311)
MSTEPNEPNEPDLSNLSNQPEPADEPGRAGRPAPGRRNRAADASGWNWLLLVPIVIPLLTPLYNRETPSFLGFPAFYWLQLLFVLLGVGTTTIVYRMTKRGN